MGSIGNDAFYPYDIWVKEEMSDDLILARQANYIREARREINNKTKNLHYAKLRYQLAIKAVPQRTPMTEIAERELNELGGGF